MSGDLKRLGIREFLRLDTNEGLVLEAKPKPMGLVKRLLASLKRPDTVHVYEDHAGKWRWRRTSVNGNIVADSGQGYTRRGTCITAAVKKNAGLVISVIYPDHVEHLL